jgi:hypothetical protein
MNHSGLFRPHCMCLMKKVLIVLILWHSWAANVSRTFRICCPFMISLSIVLLKGRNQCYKTIFSLFLAQVPKHAKVLIPGEHPPPLFFQEQANWFCVFVSDEGKTFKKKRLKPNFKNIFPSSLTARDKRLEFVPGKRTFHVLHSKLAQWT